MAAYDRLRSLERARAPSFADVLLAMPQDDGEFTQALMQRSANFLSRTDP